MHEKSSSHCKPHAVRINYIYRRARIYKTSLISMDGASAQKFIAVFQPLKREEREQKRIWLDDQVQRIEVEHPQDSLEN